MISGLSYYPDIISPEAATQLTGWIDTGSWNTDIARRRQMYGFDYNIKAKSLSSSTPITEPLLSLCQGLLPIFQAHCPSVTDVNQVIVNEYTRSQGIAAHIDAPIFGPVVASLSLLEPCNMIFTRGTEKVMVMLQPNSLLVLSGEARTSWKHEIPHTTTITDGSTVISKNANYRRVSVTFRSYTPNYS